MKKAPKSQPRGLSVCRQEGRLILRYRDHRFIGAFLSMVGCFWLLMLVPGVKLFADSGSLGIPELAALCPFLGMGLVFSYVGLARFFNETTLTFTPQTLKIQHHPFPWPSALELPLAHITGYRITLDSTPQDSRQKVTSRLIANLKNGESRILLRAISRPKVARCLFEEAQAHLSSLSSN